MVSILGAGAGDPDLITVKGLKKLREADVLIYAGSLVNPELLKEIKESCEVYNSAYMNLEEVCAVIASAEQVQKNTVRLHTGDPSIYGAIREQMDWMRQKGISYEVVPGVSSFCAAAASLEAEYTLPDVTQTVILTRLGGATPVPEKEALENLAQHGATLIIFLSVDRIGEVVEKISDGYGIDTPAAVVYKASWPEEIIVRGTLSDIEEKTKAAGISKTALIIISRCLGEEYSLSRLYDKSFKTGYRQ